MGSRFQINQDGEMWFISFVSCGTKLPTQTPQQDVHKSDQIACKILSVCGHVHSAETTTYKTLLWQCNNSGVTKRGVVNSVAKGCKSMASCSKVPSCINSDKCSTKRRIKLHYLIESIHSCSGR